MGLKDSFKGTGVWSFLKASRQGKGRGGDGGPAAEPPRPQKAVPRKQDVAKPPDKR
jgi:hypothetical protein